MKKHFILFAILILLCACGQRRISASSWQEQYDLGIRYLSEGNYEAAIIAFTTAIEIDPNKALAYVGRGDSYIGSGETEVNLAAAHTDYEKAIELDEALTSAYLGLADVYIRTGDFDKAEKLLRLALEVVEDSQAISDKLAEFSSNTITDSQGNGRKTIWRASDGTIESYSVHHLDNERRRVRDDYYNADGTLDNYEIIIWRDNGYREDRYDADGTFLYSTNHTNLQNDSEFYSRVDSYDATGTLTQYALYGHNKTQHYDPDGTPLGYEIYEYNEAGQQTKWLRYHADGELREYYVTEYDLDGNRTRYTHYDADGTEMNHIDYSESDA